MRTVHIIIALMLAVAVQGQTQEQVLSEIKRQGIPHPHIVLAQARLETGNFKSDLCQVNKNLFGMKGGKGTRKRNGYAAYRHWRESIKDYKDRISSRYQGGDYFAFLRRIGYDMLITDGSEILTNHNKLWDDETEEEDWR